MSRERVGNVLLEYHQIGTIMRVAAIDPATNTEVTIQGPVSYGRHTLGRTAVNKLQYVLAKKAGQSQPR